MATPHIRRATEADGPAVGALVPGLVPSATADRRATFVIDGPAGVLAVLELVQIDDRLVVEHLKAPDDGHARLLVDFADAAARGIGLNEIRLVSGAMPDELARALGYRNGRKKIGRSHLEAIGVPLWRDGTASLSQSLYYRGVWAALALLVGLGSVSIAVFGSGELTWAHIALPALLCIAGTLFAVWQIFLVVKAGERSGLRRLLALTAGGAAARVFLIGLRPRRTRLVRLRALPPVRERKLATRVDTGCASACTLAFLGGVERSIGPKGRLGFHRASFPGMGDNDMYESNRGMRRFLIYSARRRRNSPIASSTRRPHRSGCRRRRN